MDNRLIVLFFMFFCHIIDDYHLQGILKDLKQKKFWQDNAPDELYKHDYIVALLTHSFSWTFMITLPVGIFLYHMGFQLPNLTIAVGIMNTIVHAYTDDLKANKFKINLICDQLIHTVQIVITWWLLIFVV